MPQCYSYANYCVSLTVSENPKKSARYFSIWGLVWCPALSSVSANCKWSSYSTVREELVYGIVVLVIEEGGHVVVFFCVTRSGVAQVFA